MCDKYGAGRAWMTRVSLWLDQVDGVLRHLDTLARRFHGGFRACAFLPCVRDALITTSALHERFQYLALFRITPYLSLQRGVTGQPQRAFWLAH